MGQINLYKMELSKKEEFLSKIAARFELRGKLIADEEGNYEVRLYTERPKERKPLEWQWILDEYECELSVGLSAPKAVLVIISEEGTYSVTYGLSYFMVDKYCDVEFAFDFARRIPFKQIKTTTLTTPHSKRNKMVNAYLDYNELDFDSGESYAKIKAKVQLVEGSLHGEVVEIGHSIKTQLTDNSIECVLKFIEYVESVRKQKELYKIPVFSKVKNKELIQELDKQLLEKLEEDYECINISELEIVGTTEVFNNADALFTLEYKGTQKDVPELTRENVLQFIYDNDWNIKEDFLEIKVISKKDGVAVYSNVMKKMIDFTDDKWRCLLQKGEWYTFNDDYIQYLHESIAELEVIYNPMYDFSKERLNDYVEKKYQEEKVLKDYEGLLDSDIKKKIKNKYYAERVFNSVLEEQYQFMLLDRQQKETGGGPMELMDLYKDETMIAVKIGSSSEKLCYVVDQSISALKAYKHKMFQDMPIVKNVAIWIVLKRKEHLPEINGQPDLSSLRMVMLKNKLDTWKKEVRVLGYTPVVYLNYWEE